MFISDDTSLHAAKILSIKLTLKAIAGWRELVARKHPNDARNHLAAELLNVLAEDAGTLPADMLTKIGACPNVREIAGRVGKTVGFRTHPGSLSEFIGDMLAEAAELQAEI